MMSGLISRALHTLTSVAPLKRVFPAWLPACDVVSPLSHECGSVEASSSFHSEGRVSSSLHTLTSVAPLKHEEVGELARAALHSPHSHECGSVEAAWRLFVAAIVFHLSTLSRVWLR